MERILRALPSKPQPLWLRYSATTILVALSFLLMKALQEFTPVRLPSFPRYFSGGSRI